MINTSDIYMIFNKFNIILTILFFFLSLKSYALTPVDQELIKQQQKTLLENVYQQKESLENALDFTGDLSLLPEQVGDVCFDVAEVKFVGAAALKLKAKMTLTAAYINRCLSATQIENLVKETTNYYLQQGYVTSYATLEEQDISSGVLVITVYENKIETITLNGKNALLLHTAFPGLIGNVLNLRDIEQGLEQLNRLSSRRITIDILPGSQQGYSIIDLKHDVRVFPVSFSLTFNNSGQKSTGRDQLSMVVTVDDLLSLADKWAFSATTNSDFRRNHKTRSFVNEFSIPYGYWTVSYQYLQSHYYTDIPLQFATWRYQGNSQSHKINVNRILYRDGNSKLAINAALTRRKAENDFAGQKLIVSSPTLTVLHAGLHYSTELLGGYFSLNPSYYQGLGLLGATSDKQAQAILPVSRFRKFSLSASYFSYLSDASYLMSSFYGQTSPDNLYGSERISIGGEYSVRGFKEQSLTGNVGFYLRNEINWPLSHFLFFKDASLSVALDAGWLKSQTKLKEGGALLGTAITLSVNKGPFSHYFSFGLPLFYPDALQTDKWVSYYQFSLSF